MPASKSDLSKWFDDGLAKGATHMIVKCDDFDYRGSVHDKCCYPVYVTPEDSVHRVDDENHDRTMEVYSYAVDRDAQLNAPARVFNYD